MEVAQLQLPVLDHEVDTDRAELSSPQERGIRGHRGEGVLVEIRGAAALLPGHCRPQYFAPLGQGADQRPTSGAQIDERIVDGANLGEVVVALEVEVQTPGSIETGGLPDE